MRYFQRNQAMTATTNQPRPRFWEVLLRCLGAVAW